MSGFCQGSKWRIEKILWDFLILQSHSTGFLWFLYSFQRFRGSGAMICVPLFGWRYRDTAELNIEFCREPPQGWSFMIEESYIQWPLSPEVGHERIDSDRFLYKKDLEQESFLPKHPWHTFFFSAVNESFGSPPQSSKNHHPHFLDTNLPSVSPWNPAKGLPPWRYPQFSGGEEWPSGHRGRCGGTGTGWGAFLPESLVVTFSEDGEVDFLCFFGRKEQNVTSWWVKKAGFLNWLKAKVSATHTHCTFEPVQKIRLFYIIIITTIIIIIIICFLNLGSP